MVMHLTEKVIGVVVGIAVVLTALVALVPTLANATGNLSDSGFPLSGVLSFTIIGLLIAAAVILAIFKGLKMRK